MKIDEDYELLPDGGYKEDEDVATIRIKTGDFAGVEFTFGKVIVEELDDKAYIKFEYKIHNKKELDGNEEFEKVLEVLMNSLLLHSLELAEVEYERRKKDIKAPD